MFYFSSVKYIYNIVLCETKGTFLRFNVLFRERFTLFPAHLFGVGFSRHVITHGCLPAVLFALPDHRLS